MRRLCIAILMLASLLASCTDSAKHARAVYVLLDVSGSYNDKLDQANPAINYLLGTLVSGDSLIVAKIDSASFTEKEVVGKVTFDDRPSVANEQKRAFRARLDEFFKDRRPSAHTDVSGALLQAADTLDETGAGHRYIMVFSDLDEDLPKGYVRKSKLPFEGAEVVAVDVAKERADNINPQRYEDRLNHWKQVVADNGGRWQVLNDPDHLDMLLN